MKWIVFRCQARWSEGFICPFLVKSQCFWIIWMSFWWFFFAVADAIPAISREILARGYRDQGIFQEKKNSGDLIHRWLDALQLDASICHWNMGWVSHISHEEVINWKHWTNFARESTKTRKENGRYDHLRPSSLCCWWSLEDVARWSPVKWDIAEEGVAWFFIFWGYSLSIWKMMIQLIQPLKTMGFLGFSRGFGCI